MSYQSDEQRSYIFNFAAPGALNQPVIAIEEQSTERTLNIINEEVSLLDAFLEDAAANGIKLRFFIRRPISNTDDTLIGDQNRLRPSVNVEVRPGYPIAMAGGQFQLVMVQTAGALTAQAVTLVFDQALVG